MQNYVESGDNLTLTAPAGGVVSSTPYLIGAALFVVAAASAAAGDPFVGRRKGIFDLPKAAALAISTGDQLYWDNTNRVLNKTSAGNTLVAIAVADAQAADTTVRAVIIQ